MTETWVLGLYTVSWICVIVNILGSKGQRGIGCGWKHLKDTILEFKKSHRSKSGTMNTEFSGFSVWKD